MKLLIDECLSPDLAPIAWTAGFDCEHVVRIGLQSAEDWYLVQRAVNDGRVFVTNNATDFKTLFGREEVHPGLVCLNFAHGHMTLASQKRLFQHALELLRSLDPVNEVLEIILHSDGLVSSGRYQWPR